MYNKELYEKILNVSCSFEELESLGENIDKEEYDLDNPFKKYYSLERILFAIDRYESKEINAKYLAHWMNAYNWIIMGGFKLETDSKSVFFEEWLTWEISDWLDSLSFFDDSDDWYNLDEYKTTFKTLDKIYRNPSDWERVFAHTDEFGDNEDDIAVLVYNAKDKEFAKIYSYLDYKSEKVEFDKIELDELNNKIDQLKQANYRELRCGGFEEE